VAVQAESKPSTAIQVLIVLLKSRMRIQKPAVVFLRTTVLVDSNSTIRRVWRNDEVPPPLSEDTSTETERVLIYWSIVQNKTNNRLNQFWIRCLLMGKQIQRRRQVLMGGKQMQRRRRKRKVGGKKKQHA
jgi:hypothetical protein